jgi:endonuclease/exonuclease/phosphatase family metal-dependent hydrolase
VRLKVVSYNICHGLGIDGIQDLNRTIKVIRESKADLVGLQEVDRHFGERSGWLDQPAVLAEQLGMYVVYGPNLELDPANSNSDIRGQYGNAILSRYPIDYYHNHPLPQVNVPGAWNERRGLLEAHVQIAGKTLRFFNTHLGLSKEERSVQLNTVLNILQTNKADCILTGDFNTEPEHVELDILLGSLQDTYASANKGVHTGTFMVTDSDKTGIPVKCIDYIFCSSEIDVAAAEVHQTYISDHLPLIAELELDEL